MACFESDGFQESMTALKLGGLVLEEEQKAALYAVTLKKQDCLCILTTGFRKSLILFYYYIYLFYFIYYYCYIYLYCFILFTHEVARPRNAGRK